MTTLTIQPTKWSDMPHISAVKEFSEDDNECLMEIRDVLMKHGNLNRFGIYLLHNHFEVGEDEFLLEMTDESQRTQVIQPVKKERYKDEAVTITSLRLVEGDVLIEMGCRCGKDGSGNHIPGVHIGVPDDTPY
ncbi:MAG: hypothetical protein JST90_17360 [Bacteroidetes bacterium]|nr:hypothetical protein [Bacteroidota bacterium]